MAEGDSFLGFLKDAVNSVPILGAYSNAAWGRGNYDPNAAPTKDIFSADATAGERLASVVNAVPGMHVAGTATSFAADHFAPLKFVLDFGNRTADSYFTGVAAETDSDTETTFADGWVQGWDSWGQQDHLTAGDVLGAALSGGGPTGISPFTQQGVRETQALARSTWYGDLAGATTDVAAGFLGVPVAKFGTLGRGASTLTTLADVEDAATAFNAGTRAGKGSALFKPNAPAVHASHLETLADQLYTKADSMTDAVNFLGPLVGQASGRSTRVLAEIATTARELDPVMGKHVIGNAILTAMGSAGARAELMSVDPLIASKIANATSAPGVLKDAAKAADELIAQYKVDPSKVDVNGIMAKIYDTPRKQAEVKALEDRIAKAKIEAGWTADLKARFVSLKPPKVREKVNGQWVDTFDTARLKESRLKADSQYKDLAAQLDEAKANLNGTKRWSDGANKQVGPALDAVAKSSEGIGAAKGISAEQGYLRQSANMDVKAAARSSKEQGVRVRWVDAELRSAKAEIRKMKDAASPDAQARFATLQAELDVAQRARDGAALDSIRAKAVAEARRTDVKTVDRAAMQAAAERLTASAKASATDVIGNAADYRGSLGAAQQKVDDLAAQVAQAKADRELLASTPLGRGRSEQVDALNAQKRVLERELKADREKLGQIAPTLNSTYNWLSDLDSLGQSDSVIATMRLKPSKLDRMKTAIRDEIGQTYLYSAGDLNRKVAFHVMPKSWAANIGTAYGRSAINVLDRYVGAQELGMYLKRSKVYDGPEVKNLTEEFHRLQPGQVQAWVDGVHKDMLERLVNDITPGLSAQDVQKAVGSVATGMGQHRAYLQQALKDAESEGRNWARVHEFPDETASDAIHYVDAAYLRSHLAETASFADPVKMRQALKDFQSGGNLAHAAFRDATKVLDMTVTGWKIASILRPGLMFRNMLDSNVRAFAIMGAAPTMAQASKGTYHLFKNSGMRIGNWVSARDAKLPGLVKIGAQDPSGVARNMLNEVNLKLGKADAKVSLYDLTDSGDISAVSLAATRTAMTKGVSPAQGLLSTGTRSGFTNVSESRTMYKADSIEWPIAYQQHAQVLLASPTARKLLEMDTLDALEQGASLPQFTKELFSNPAIRDEYAKLREYHDMTPQQFVDQVLRETEIMFPDAGMAADLLAGKFHGRSGKKWVEENFPREQRFDVPGEESIFNLKGVQTLRAAVNKTFDVLQDRPDFYLARHPVGFYAFQKQARLEAARLYESRVARLGEENAKFTADDFKKIEARARAHAISTVRDYMYDATRQTGVSATATLNRLVPFFAPWADTMRAYSRLMYDDPSRLFKIAGLYNVPFNINHWTDNPFIVDENGDRLAPGADTSKAFVLIGGEWGTTPNGVKKHEGGIALRASSFNTILQGEVPWLPGWGPAVQIPVQMALNNNDELALYLSQSKDPLTQTFMKSLFMDGEVPAGDATSVWKSVVPSWLRRMVDAKDGVTYAQNLGYIMNARKIAADQRGEPFDYQKNLAEAQKEATNAAWLQTIAQFGVGISGDAQVQGKFYVQRMHEFQALSQVDPTTGISPLKQQYGVDSPTAAFALMFPEAKDLSWSFTRNETGISATVTAQSAALKNKALIDANPDYGWFIVGGENIAPDEFSSTAYGQQRQDTYGAAEKGRKRLDPGEIAQKVRVSQGWSDFTKYTTDLSNQASQLGLDPAVVSAARKALIASIGQQNPDWFSEYNNRSNKVADFYQRADLIAQDPRLKDRQDIAMYAVYRQAQKEVLGAFGLNSFAGTGAKSEQAKWAMYQIGSQMARQNLGFQQMWERVLATDVEPDIKQGVTSGGTTTGANSPD